LIVPELDKSSIVDESSTLDKKTKAKTPIVDESSILDESSPPMWTNHPPTNVDESSTYKEVTIEVTNEQTIRPLTTTSVDVSDESFQSLCRQIWNDYSSAYFDRYGTQPIRNAKVNSQVRELAKRLGQEAPQVARFFLTVNDQFILKQFHQLGLLVSGAEAIRTQWATGKTMTSAKARQIDQTATNMSNADETIAMLRARNASRENQQRAAQ
jgi:hypothetical protein